MTDLPGDVSRCIGWVNDGFCPLRGHCERHEQIFRDDQAGRIGNIPIIMNCYQDGEPTLHWPTTEES